MAFTLPLPVRVAAGILATGIERVRALPDDIPALPVTLVGNAMRLTMKVQQEIATLATRGDELLGGVIAAPQENPSWARFDDDELAPSGTGTGTGTGTGIGTAAPSPARAATERVRRAPPGPAGKSGSGKPKKPNNVIPKVHPHPENGGGAPAPEQVTSATETVRVAGEGADAAYAIDDAVSSDIGINDTATNDTGTNDTATNDTGTNDTGTNDTATLTTPDATSMPPITTTAMEAAIEVPESLVELATEASEPPANEPPAAAEATPTTTPDTAGDVPDVDVTDTDVTDAADIDLTYAYPTDIDLTYAYPTDIDLTDAAPDTVVFEETEELTEQITVPDALREEVEEGADGPATLPGYDLMTLAQVRGHLRDLSADDVTALLDYERLADNRAPFLTLLSNRLVTLDAQQS